MQGHPFLLCHQVLQRQGLRGTEFNLMVAVGGAVPAVEVGRSEPAVFVGRADPAVEVDVVVLAA